MKNIAWILLVCVTLWSCKSRKSQVHKSSIDSNSLNLELNNLDVKAGLYRVTNASGTLDSNWNIAMRFENFSGIIYTDGKVEGKADQAEVIRGGSKSTKENQTVNEGDTTRSTKVDLQVEETSYKKKEIDRQKEVEGMIIPWWVWLLGIAAILLLGYFVVSKVKSKLKPF
ncbi:hypothetical protein KO02_17465 [Sphingobacterium sp. ML3W]|uniref:hypothetical protein n=1 Tax=Sphingobacterium sp. ML3W TaxID=1538644 RepID=UPI0004F8C296|nr:hypothetical protein [Sphingobacterium sp. ML3W]AIM38273.1 hypothetical protein KO02_17465 [Sphingobacterium sp. ML3W]